jgi:hypothetical protein
VLTATAYAFLQGERLRRRRDTLTFPQARAVITDILTAHYLLTHRRQLKMLLELAELPLRIYKSRTSRHHCVEPERPHKESGSRRCPMVQPFPLRRRCTESDRDLWQPQ